VFICVRLSRLASQDYILRNKHYSWPIADRPFAKTAGRNSDSYLKRITDLSLTVSCFRLCDNLIKDTEREIRIRVNLGINIVGLLDSELRLTKKRVAFTYRLQLFVCSYSLGLGQCRSIVIDIDIIPVGLIRFSRAI